MKPLQAAVPLDPDICWPVLLARDARFDGRIFVGISSTGVYCRPVCSARTPKKEHCSFFPSAAAAEAAGYRPCLKCRPELAPGLAPVDASPALARRAAARMEDGLWQCSLEQLAAALGVTGRHLRRVFLAEYGVPPVQYLQTRRLLLAKSLLTDTDLPVTQAAFAAGFGSLRRFNALFQQRYRLSPSALRRQKEGPAVAQERITLFLGYRPPYLWDELLAFLQKRAIPGVEEVCGGFYRRTAALLRDGERCCGLIEVRPEAKKNALAVTVSASLLPVLAAVLARVRQLFDLDCDPQEIGRRLLPMNRLQDGLCRPGARLPGCFEPFETGVRAVLGQQITVRAATVLAGRVAAALGTPLPDLPAGPRFLFPSAADVAALGAAAEDRLCGLGITRGRARSILALAQALAEGRLDLSAGADPQRQLQVLLSLPGFGPWTAQYVAMRTLSWTDAFLYTDCGVKKALPGRTPKQLLALSGPWAPWRSYATVNLWNFLETKKGADAR